MVTKRGFAMEEINLADGEMVIAVSEGLADVMSQALLTFKQPWDDQSNPALMSLGQFVRDAACVLRGEPLHKFPLLQRIHTESGLVCSETNYEDG